MAELSGHVAIVTGGGRGLGRAVAERLAGMGAAVVVASRNAPELDDVVKGIKRAGGRALAQTADIGDERQVQELVLAAPLHAHDTRPGECTDTCRRQAALEGGMQDAHARKPRVGAKLRERDETKLGEKRHVDIEPAGRLAHGLCHGDVIP